MCRCIISAMVLLVSAPYALGNDERTADVKKVIESVDTEIRKTPGHAWAGKYRGHLGIDTFTLLYVAPETGIAYEANDNSGVHESNAGSVDVSDSEMSITWRHAENHLNVPTIERKLLIVPWGDVVFLVPQCAVHRFCLDARQHPKRLLSTELVRNEAGVKELSGKPVLPKEFGVFWDLPQISASVVTIGDTKTEQIDDKTKRCTQIVKLDKGAADHIYVGMRLECQRIARRFTVVATDQDSCTAVSEVTAKRSTPIRLVRRRWTLTTSTW